MQWIFYIQKKSTDFVSSRAIVISPAWPPGFVKLECRYSVLVRKKTPNPFIVACDKFIYLEILKNRSENEAESAENKSSERDIVDAITPKVIKLISSTISDLADDEGWAFLGDVGSLLQKKQPNFDSRNFGFLKLTPLIYSIKIFEIEQRESQKGRSKLIYVNPHYS